MIVERREFEPNKEQLFSTSVFLIHPELARAHGINTDMPVFVDNIASLRHPAYYDSPALVYNIGGVVTAEEGKRLSFTLGLDSYSCASSGRGFIAIMEPIGKAEAAIVDNYGIFAVRNVFAEAARIKEIRAYCMSRDKDHRSASHHARDAEETQTGIKEGFIVMSRDEVRALQPVCSDHELYPYEVQYNFRVTKEGEVIFIVPAAMPK